MPFLEAPSEELGSAPQDSSVVLSPSPSEISTASSPEPQPIRATPLFRALAMPPPEPEQPRGQDELERRLPGYQRIVIPRELSLIELLKQSSGVSTDDEVLQVREARLRVVAERVGLRRLNVLAPRLRSLTLDGSAIASLRELGIGLVHLKVLSVNRCGLTSLDGVWGLGALRELSAAGNRLSDLQPLAALQKLHTLNVSGNPISDVGRLWTLGICSSLRRLTLTGTAASDTLHYRSEIAAALPMLVYLDDRPLHTDVEYDSDGMFGVDFSDSGESDGEMPKEIVEIPHPTAIVKAVPFDAQPGSSSDQQWDLPLIPGRILQEEGDGVLLDPEKPRHRRRPATTECVGLRPCRPKLPPRPQTAVDRSELVIAPTKLQILNTLLDEEWRCSGSDLTSQSAVCGNLARALRRTNTRFKSNKSLVNSVVGSGSIVGIEPDPTTTTQEVAAGVNVVLSGDRNSANVVGHPPVRSDGMTSCERLQAMLKTGRSKGEAYVQLWTIIEAEKELIDATLEDPTRALAAEIPRAPIAEDWLKFKEETGIDFGTDFKDRALESQPGDADKAIERLEQIEKETYERLKNGNSSKDFTSEPPNFASVMSDFETWNLENVPTELNFYRLTSDVCLSDSSE